jgi:hypothetical protein
MFRAHACRKIAVPAWFISVITCQAGCNEQVSTINVAPAGCTYYGQVVGARKMRLYLLDA